MTISEFFVEMRSSIDGNKLVGHASVFNVVAKVPGHYEQMDRKAFDEVLKRSTTDVRATINHDPSLLLARQSAGTLRLQTDDEGLAFEADLPDTSYARDLRILIERGDINGASFKFAPGRDKWSRTTDGYQLRTHTSVEQLLDVSAVTYPAYEGAGVAMRSYEFRSNGRDQLIRARARVHLWRGENEN